MDVGMRGFFGSTAVKLLRSTAAIVLLAGGCSGKDSDLDESTVDPGDSGDVASGDAASGDVGSGDVGSGDVGSGDVGSGDVGSGDVGPGDVGSGVALTGTAELIRKALEEQSERLPGYQDAALRLVAALDGGEADGVTVSVSGQSKLCNVLADLDGDGARETSIAVNITYETAAMAADEAINLSISLGLPGEPRVSVAARITPTGDSKAEVSEATAQLETDTVSIYGSEGQGSLDPAASADTDLVAMKFTSFDKDYVDRVDGRFTLRLSEDGYRLRVVVDDDPSTPEDETIEFFVDGDIFP